MCGICGGVGLEGEAPTRAVIESMTRALRHRGPDASGFAASGPAALGHARLSILDHAGGGQPMASDDGGLLVTFNGEIFNHVELAADLVARGHVLRTRSDTEVLLRAYQEYGDECVSRFNGQWAFAIWDARRRRLLLSRDRLGVCPLYYTRAAGHFLFASEVKALFRHPAVERRLDPFGLAQIFTFWAALPPRTVFEGVDELPPGHSLVLENGRATTRAYWRPAFDPDPAPEPEDVQAERLRELLLDASRLRLRADVPVAAYLSGGLDSTLTTALAARAGGAPPATFSLAFRDPEYDESAFQAEASAFLGTPHETLTCDAADVGACFPDVIRHAERPILRTAPAPLYLLARLVRERGFKVAITGEGADEVMAGYDLFREAKLRRAGAASPRAALLRRLYPYQSHLQTASAAQLNWFFAAREGDGDNPFFSHLPRWRMTAGLHLFFSAGTRAALAGYDPADDFRAMLPAEFGRWPELGRAQYLEMACLLPGYILSAQGDRMAMAHAVEGRFPFLDHRVVEFAGRLSPHRKLHGMREKHLLKRAAAGLVPPSIIRRPKQPYRAPEAASFLGGGLEYVEGLLAPDRIRADGVFDPAAAGALVAKARASGLASVRDNMAFVGLLSTGLVVDRFLNRRGCGDE